MMTSDRTKTCFLAVVVFSLILAAGCAVTPPDTEVSTAAPVEPTPQPPQPPAPPQPPEPEVADLILKFEPGDATTYRLITEGKRNVTYEGSLANDPAFKGGDTGDKVEMTFSQLIESLNDRGNAVAKITIKELKYQAQVKSDTVLDFDSSREQDQNNALAKLVGQSYTIELTPTGQVTKVIDSKQAQAAVKPDATARRLLESNTIKQRHSVPSLPAAGKNKVRLNGHWSRIKTVDFGMMGAKSYEKIYVLKEIKHQDGGSSAVVEMNAIPTAETADGLHQEQPASAFSKMFDNVEEYTGQLTLDLSAGKVLQYVEKMNSEWLVVDPMAGQQPNKKPDSLRMGAVSLYRIEKVD
jgi:hypothetical protein